jgi:hypothetical protein
MKVAAPTSDFAFISVAIAHQFKQMRTSNVELRTSNFEVKNGELSAVRRSKFDVRRSQLIAASD